MTERPTKVNCRYYVWVADAIVYEGDSAVSALDAISNVPAMAGEPTVIRFDGAALYAHSPHELGWDADAERACGDPTYYWPRPGERGPYLREVAR